MLNKFLSHFSSSTARVFCMKVYGTKIDINVRIFSSCELNMINKKMLTKISVLYAIVSFPIFIIGSKYGAIGLSWAFVIAALINMTYQWYIFRRLLQNLISYSYGIVLISVVAFLSWITGNFEINLPIVYRLLFVLFMSFSLIVYLYKYEYKRIISA